MCLIFNFYFIIFLGLILISHKNGLISKFSRFGKCQKQFGSIFKDFMDTQLPIPQNNI